MSEVDRIELPVRTQVRRTVSFFEVTVSDEARATVAPMDPTTNASIGQRARRTHFIASGPSGPVDRNVDLLAILGRDRGAEGDRQRAPARRDGAGAGRVRGAVVHGHRDARGGTTGIDLTHRDAHNVASGQV